MYLVRKDQGYAFTLTTLLVFMGLYLSPSLAVADDPEFDATVLKLESNDVHIISSAILGIGGCAKFGDKECREIIIGLWKGENLAKAKPNYKVINTLRTLLAGEVVPLGGDVSKEAEEFLYATLGSDDLVTRADAYLRLYKIGNVKSVKLLDAAIDKDHPLVSASAIEALLMISKSKSSGAKLAQDIIKERNLKSRWIPVGE